MDKKDPLESSGMILEDYRYIRISEAHKHPTGSGIG